jgi:hypothetical protein
VKNGVRRKGGWKLIQQYFPCCSIYLFICNASSGMGARLYKELHPLLLFCYNHES